MSSLYELTADYLEVLEMAESGEVEYQTVIDTLESIQGEIEVKADGYAKIIKALEGQADALKKEEDRLASKRRSIDTNIKNMKTSLEKSMIITGNTKLKTTLFSFIIQRNPASLVIDKPNEIPEQFLIPQDPKVDNAKIKELLKTQELPFAHLSYSESLRIR